MALSSALFSGTSGLTAMGDTMQIIGDNIANVNTIGFKGSKADFQDLLSQSLSTMSGTTQIGSGSAIGNVSASFKQGSFKTTGNATDLAIGGSGFFILREETGVNQYYTRAGNFRFDKDGNLVNPNNHVVQGWRLDPDTGSDVGSIGDIKLNSFTSQPSQSTNIQVIANLDSTAENFSVITADKTLKGGWDGTAMPPVQESAYEYQTTVQVYDSLGSTHDITMYFDKADPATAPSSYEFMITCNPSEDMRPGATGNMNAGLLGFGQIAFDSASGAIKDITMTRVSGDGSLDPLAAVTKDASIGAVGSNFAVTTNGADATSGSQEINADDTQAGNITEMTVEVDGAGAVTIDDAWLNANAATTSGWTDITTASQLATALSNLTGVTAATGGDGVIVTSDSTGSTSSVALTITGGAADTDVAVAGRNAEASVATIDITDAEAENVDGTTLQFGGVDIDTSSIIWANVTDGASLATALANLSDIATASFNDVTNELTITAALAGATDFAVLSGSGLTDEDGTPATTSNLENGLFTFKADFLGGGAGEMNISLDLGARHNGDSWVNNALSTTQYAVASNTVFKDSNGYGAGDLQDINVNDKGMITGSYSNGEIIPLYRVALAGFQNEDGLIKEGGNLFRASLASGAAITNRPGSNGLGSIAPGSLEQSNVDIASEFVDMITTQRGFQANSKTITTIDNMLSELINLKR
jgi:flagellar hook protein FlgE